MIRIAAFSVLAGAAVFANIELVFRRMTKGMDLEGEAPALRVDLVARVHLPPEQLRPPRS